MPFNFSFGAWLTLHGIVTLSALLLYVITSHVMVLRRSPAEAIAWVLFITLIPYLALPVYLVFGSRKIAARTAVPVHALSFARTDSWAVRTAAALGQPAPASYSALNIHADGSAAALALLEIIASARHSIALCTFILRRDSMGSAVIDSLCERARSGVNVRVLIDGVGRWMAAGPDMQTLVKAGGAWLPFAPPWRALLSRSGNLRNHRKLVIADAGHASARLWCGGRNIAAEYFEGTPSAPPWRDLSFDLLGDAVGQAQTIFDHDWQFAARQPINVVPRLASMAAPVPLGAQLLSSGPDQAEDTLHAMLLTAAYQARESIVMITPYFVPDSALLSALCLAARRGVAIKLIVPNKSNHLLSDLARNRAMRSLAQAGGCVRLADAGSSGCVRQGKQMLHAKLVVIDDCLALVGSANLDTRSLFLNYEVMMAFHNPVDVRRFADWVEHQNIRSMPYIVRAPGPMRDIAEGLLLWIAFEL